jgi:NAD(P)-dependent dehydrogenase (short-subunit alcohol dehydrogenase family)
VAIVTGGASGIGRALCEELAHRGAHPIIADIDAEGAQAVAAAISRHGGKADFAHLDVTCVEEVQRLVENTAERHGRLDFMFNNAGIGVGGEVRDLRHEHWQRAIDINLWGVVYGTTAAYAAMLRHGSGHIVNIASVAGLIGEPGLAPYSVTKSAVVALSTALRLEAEALGIRVSVVCPGFVQTAIFDSAIGVAIDKEEFLKRLPFRLLPASEAARAILRGLERNQGIIVFPFYARLLWWLTRIHPGLLSPLRRRTMRHLRAMRDAGSIGNRP